jgi:L-ascorbate metabolism protein UlaG (beta-lactamase superfamily)
MDRAFVLRLHSGMITPTLQDDALVDDFVAAPDDGTNFHLWWLGQSGFLLKWRGHSVLLDPYLSDSLTAKYAGTDKEHIRMTQRCVAPERLGFVEVVASSHAHTDHFDAETLVPLAQSHHGLMPIILPFANLDLARERLAAAEFSWHGLDEGKQVTIGEFTFTAIPSAHDLVEHDEAGHCRYLGFIVRFGPWTLYHSGDTRWHEDLPRLVGAHQPDVVLLPINGHDPKRQVAGNLDGLEAATLAHNCGASLAIPHHFEMFTFNTADPDLFTDACARLNQRCHVLRAGGRWSSQKLAPRQPVLAPRPEVFRDIL